MSKSYICRFDEIGIDDVPWVGGKNALAQAVAATKPIDSAAALTLTSNRDSQYAVTLADHIS